MGYSLTVHATPEGHPKMLSFLQANYRSWALVSTGAEDPENQGSSDPTDDVSYDKGKGHIGFDYSSWLPSWERVYIYAVSRWIALKVGKRKTRFSKNVVDPNEFPEPVPYIVYDGHERWPVLVKASYEAAQQLPKGQRWCAVDAFGVPLDLGGIANVVWISLALEKARMEAYTEDLKSQLGECPDDPEGREKHLERMNEILLHHIREPLEARLLFVRDELKRLDGLWSSAET